MDRLTADGPELSPQDYAALLDGHQWSGRTARHLLGQTLDGRGPDLSASDDLAAERWLYLAAARRPDAARAHGSPTGLACAQGVGHNEVPDAAGRPRRAT